MFNAGSYTVQHLEAIRDLLEMHSDSESLLQGAAGEDALNVGDVLGVVRYTLALRDALAGVRGCAAIEGLKSSAWREVVKELDRILEAK